MIGGSVVLHPENRALPGESLEHSYSYVPYLLGLVSFQLISIALGRPAHLRLLWTACALSMSGWAAPRMII
ncbi:hypothetical protein EMIT0324P_21189 [Pseudomonas chlororaphis]